MSHNTHIIARAGPGCPSRGGAVGSVPYRVWLQPPARGRSHNGIEPPAREGHTHTHIDASCPPPLRFSQAANPIVCSWASLPTTLRSPPRQHLQCHVHCCEDSRARSARSTRAIRPQVPCGYHMAERAKMQSHRSSKRNINNRSSLWYTPYFRTPPSNLKEAEQSQPRVGPIRRAGGGRRLNHHVLSCEYQTSPVMDAETACWLLLVNSTGSCIHR